MLEDRGRLVPELTHQAQPEERGTVNVPYNEKPCGDDLSARFFINCVMERLAALGRDIRFESVTTGKLGSTA